MRLFVAIYIVPGAKDMLTIVFRSFPYWRNAKMSRWIASSKDYDTRSAGIKQTYCSLC